MNYLKWSVAELLGTFFLALCVGVVVASVSVFPEYQNVYIPFVIGAVVTGLIYLLGPTSGAHFNPAVSFSLFLINKVSLAQVLVDIPSQVVGAFLGFKVAKLLVGFPATPPLAAGNSAILAEFLGTFILVFAVSVVVLGKVSNAVSGFVIGLALMIGLTISMVASGGILNPAIALGWGTYQVAYLIAPLVGGAGAAVLANWLYQKNNEGGI